MKKVSKIPEHQNVYEQLRDMISLGKLTPGQSLTIMGLADTLAVGMTPVREALRRLAAENAVKSLDNRRIVVPELNRTDIEDIYFLRFEVESELARRACIVIQKQQIDALQEIDTAIDAALEQGDIEAYLERNNRFHFLIYGIANAPVLFHVARTLWVQIGPSQRIVCGRYGTANLPDKHSKLLDAFRAADGDAAAQALKGDLQQGLSLIVAPAVSKI